MKRPPFVIPPTVFLATFAAMALLDRVPFGRDVLPAAARAFAPAPLALGALLGGWALLLFLRARTTPEPGRTPSALVATGPYRFTRNPMYLGLALWLLAWGLHLGSAAPFVGPPLFVWAIDRLFVRGEEAALQARFGAEARAFFARTRRWL